MKVGPRLTLIAAGMFMLLYAELSKGHLAYDNGFLQIVFAPGAIAAGALICLIALLPSSWVARLIPERHKHLVLRHHPKRQHASGNAEHD